MGLFSSNYVTSVGTSVSRVVQDEFIVPSTKIGLTTGIFSQDPNQLVENVMESVIGGMGIRAERMYSYAKRNYATGLPTSKISTSTDGKAETLGVLQAAVSGATMGYYHVGALNNLHAGWVKLVDGFAYNSVTNELVGLSASKGHPVYLKDMVAVVKEATLTERDNGSLDQWGTAANLGVTPERTASPDLATVALPTPFRVDAAATVNDAIEITYVWIVPTLVVITPAVTRTVQTISSVPVTVLVKKTEVINGEVVTTDVPIVTEKLVTTETIEVTPAITEMKNILHEESLLWPLTEYDRAKDYVHVQYKNAALDKYLLYQIGSGIYPQIDSVFNVTPGAPGEFFPFTYFRHRGASMGADKTSSDYKVSERMLKTLGINYDDVIKSINENPDISKIDQALMMYAIPADGKDPLEMRYLFDFFSKLHSASVGTNVGTGWDIGSIDNLDNHGVPLDIASPDYWLTELIGGSGGSARISMRIEDARLSTALSCANILKKTCTGVIAAVNKCVRADTQETVMYTYTKREVTGTTPSPRGEDMPVYADVTHQYAVVTDVITLRKQITPFVYEEVKVYDLKMTFFMWGDYSTIADDLAPFLMVPLDHAITKHYNVMDKEALYSRSLYFIFNARVVTEVAWYQQSWFGAFVKFVGIVLTCLSMGSDGGWFAMAADTIVEVGIMGLAVITAMDLAINLLILEALKLFVKAVGGELALVLAVVLMVYASYKGFKAGSLKGAPWATELLSIGNGLVTTVNKSITESMQLLSKESDEFNLLMKEQWETLKEVKKSMTHQNILNPRLIYGQTPDELYNATYAGNIGVSGGIGSITSYVDIALTLPKLNDTLGGNENGNTV